ncbi:MAG: hypothetical protein S4CHLAM6_15020 [Chlamydiae bacterium]|nr:hypothetical protein [Chlamydiota bacterium]
MKSSSHVKTKDQSSNKNRLTRKSKRTQTAEGWRRSVEKICEKRREKKAE